MTAARASPRAPLPPSFPLPVMSPAADGTRENPMTAMTEPVTSGGNRCRIRPNHGATATVTSPETMVAPNTAARP